MFRETFNLAIKAILKNKVRTFLTMLGIIIGTAAVIIIMNLMNSIQANIKSEFASIGTLSINTMVYDKSKAFTKDEVDAIIEENSDLLSGYSPTVSIPKTEVSNTDGSNRYTTTLTGVGLGYDTISYLKLDQGSFFNYVDITYSQPEAVIGSYTAKTLFGDESPIGQEITVNGQNFKVKGVLEENESLNSGEKGSSDDVIYVPYTSAAKFSQTAKLSDVIYEAKDSEHVTEAVMKIRDIYLDRFKDNRKFIVFNAQVILDILNQVFSFMSTLILVMTSVSLVVGGIGIMNIMFISVIERTKEIGIRTAIGAKPSLILRQFLLEAIVTSLVGGIIGIVIGLVVAYIGCKWAGIDFYLSTNSIILAFFFSFGVGCLFGYLPARRAAYLNPISALNTE